MNSKLREKSQNQKFTKIVTRENDQIYSIGKSRIHLIIFIERVLYFPISYLTEHCLQIFQLEMTNWNMCAKKNLNPQSAEFI